MGAVSYPTLSTVKPLLYKLVNRTLEVKENDTVVAKEVKLNIKRDLQERYSTPSVARILNITTFLDPRYKELPFLDQLTRRRIIDEVQDELLVMEETEKEDPPEVEEVIEGEPPSKKKKGPVEKIIGELFESHTQQHLPLHSDKVQKELDMYKAESPPDLDSDPLAWWSSRKELYPLMSKLVQRMFSFVATSVPSERLFSTTGNVITDKRNRLTSEHADQLIFFLKTQSNSWKTMYACTSPVCFNARCITLCVWLISEHCANCSLIYRDTQYIVIQTYNNRDTYFPISWQH